MTIVLASIVLLNMKGNEEKEEEEKKRITNKMNERSTNFVNFFATLYLKERERKREKKKNNSALSSNL